MRLDNWQRALFVGVVALLLLGTTMAAAETTSYGDRPWRMDYSGEFEMFVEPDWCPPGTAPVHMWGVGRAGQIDRFTFDAWHCADFENNQITHAYQVLTTEDGDLLYGTYDGYLEPAVTSTNYYTGGTGRLVDVVAVAGPAETVLVWTSETTGFASGTMYGTIGRQP